MNWEQVRVFFADDYPEVIAIDLSEASNIDVAADAHLLPFADNTFESVVGVDILHHMAHPATALKEAARVLRSGGRLILVEPWSGPVGFLFYRYIHHEDCHAIEDPWEQPFVDRQNVMEGNATIPKTIFVDRSAELKQRVPELRSIHAEPFGFLSYLLTGGFRSWGFSANIIKILTQLESRLPKAILSFISTRVLFVLEKS